MNPLSSLRRRALLVLALAVLVLAGLVIRYVIIAAQDAAAPAATVAQLLRDPDHYRGKQVSLVLAEGQRPGDPVAPFVTRSDIHLHDDTGSVLLIGGWQDWNHWRTGGGPFVGQSLRIDARGTWTIHRATVDYTDQGMPFLTVER